MGKSSGTDTSGYRCTEEYVCAASNPISHFLVFYRLEEFLVPELQATEEEKSKLESGLTNGDEPMDQDLSVLPTKCISSVENLEIRSVIPANLVASVAQTVPLELNNNTALFVYWPSSRHK